MGKKRKKTKTKFRPFRLYDLDDGSPPAGFDPSLDPNFSEDDNDKPSTDQLIAEIIETIEEKRGEEIFKELVGAIAMLDEFLEDTSVTYRTPPPFCINVMKKRLHELVDQCARNKAAGLAPDHNPDATEKAEIELLSFFLAKPSRLRIDLAVCKNGCYVVDLMTIRTPFLCHGLVKSMTLSSSGVDVVFKSYDFDLHEFY